MWPELSVSGRSLIQWKCKGVVHLFTCLHRNFSQVRSKGQTIIELRHEHDHCNPITCLATSKSHQSVGCRRITVWVCFRLLHHNKCLVGFLPTRDCRSQTLFYKRRRWIEIPDISGYFPRSLFAVYLPVHLHGIAGIPWNQCLPDTVWL